MTNKLEYKITLPESCVEVDQDTCLKWSGSYNGLRWEISNHSRRKSDSYYSRGDENGTWCYYITIRQEQVSKELWENIYIEPDISESYGKVRASYNYYDCILNNADWHGGIYLV